MSSLHKITLEFLPGSNISDVIWQTKNIQRMARCIVETSFNGFVITITNDEIDKSVSAILKEYDDWYRNEKHKPFRCDNCKKYIAMIHDCPARHMCTGNAPENKPGDLWELNE